jgi:osmotically-inducible protein OsmY
MIGTLQTKKLQKLIRWALSSAFLLHVGLSSSLKAADAPVAEVPPGLTQSEAYAEYARTLVQLDLLANPATAYLPITVSHVGQGTLNLSGLVTNNKLRGFVLDSARRISGLAVRDTMQIGQVDNDYFVNVTTERLEALTSETLSALFPELSKDVRTTVTGDGVVVLNGTVPSYEAKLSLSQAVKSQPGCKAVVNLLLVPANEASGAIAVSEDGSLTLQANELPSIPAAPLVSFDKTDTQQPSVRALTAATMADDTPQSDPFARQVEEDVRIKLQRSSSLAGMDFDIAVNGSEVTVTGKLENREQVEEVVAITSEIAGLTKIVAKCTPYTVQKNIPVQSVQETADEEAKKKKFLGFVPVPVKNRGTKEKSALSEWRFRESIKKTLKKRCEDRVDDLEVRDMGESILIEGEVGTARDRSFVLKQIDNVVELRGRPYEVALRVLEK